MKAKVKPQENAVRWFEIYVQNMARAKRFYEAVFKRRLERLKAPVPGLEMCAFNAAMDKMGTGGALVKMKGFPSGGNSTLVYFGCEDCAVEAARVLKHGGKLEKKKFAIGPYGFIALAYDTEGNMIGLHSMK